MLILSVVGCTCMSVCSGNSATEQQRLNRFHVPAEQWTSRAYWVPQRGSEIEKLAIAASLNYFAEDIVIFLNVICSARTGKLWVQQLYVCEQAGYICSYGRSSMKMFSILPMFAKIVLWICNNYCKYYRISQIVLKLVTECRCGCCSQK